MNLPKLNLPEYSHKFRTAHGKNEIWDTVRKKYVSLLPEEWVRQNFICFLDQLGYSKSLMKIESSLSYNQREKRPDILVYSNTSQALIIVECKSPDIRMSQSVFDQASVYNKKIGALVLIITNGLTHYCCKQDFESNQFIFLDSIPTYQDLINS